MFVLTSDMTFDCIYDIWQARLKYSLTPYIGHLQGESVHLRMKQEYLSLNYIYYRPIYIQLSSIIVVIILHFRSSIINVIAIRKVIHPIHRVLIVLLNRRWPISPPMLADDQCKNSKEQNGKARTDGADQNNCVVGRGLSVGFAAQGKFFWGECVSTAR